MTVHWRAHPGTPHVGTESIVLGAAAAAATRVPVKPDSPLAEAGRRPNSTMTWRGRVAIAAALVLAVAGWTAGAAPPAWAHDVLLHTAPTAGATVATVPPTVVLTFGEPALALGTAVEILGPAGDVASGPPVLVGSTVREAVRAGAPAGAYTVRWRVTSADGHPVSGAFTFTARGSGGSARPAPAEPVTGGAHTGAGPSVVWWASAAALALAALLAAVHRARRHGGSAPRHGAEGRPDD
jgi:copper resistance protein C